MDRVFEHEVDEVGIGLDKLIQLLEVLELASLLLVEDVEVVFASIQLHVLDIGGQISLLLRNLLVPLFKLLFLFLKGADLLVNLFFHHLVQVLLLDFKLLHDTAEGLLQTVDLIIELLANFQFQLGIEFLTGRGLTLVHFNLSDHLLHHSFHVQHYVSKDGRVNKHG